MEYPRLSAVRALLAIFTKNARPKVAIESFAQGLDTRDRAFLMEIVYGVLRYRDTIDFILTHFLKNPAKLGELTRNNLRTALYQLLFMRVPERAVVHEAVDVEKITSSATSQGKASLVNAVLRNFLRQKEQFALPLKCDDPIAGLALNTSHPSWLIRRWITRFGIDSTAELANANNTIPPMTIRVNTLKNTRKELMGELNAQDIQAIPTMYSPDGLILTDGQTHAGLSHFSGRFFIQDEASQLIAFLLDPKPGERVLDACAAPGGKTTHIAQLMGDKGEVLAVEKDPARVSRIRENVDSLGVVSVKILNSDITELRDAGTFDRILLDAPCSALGVIRRNPDVKYRHKPKDLLGFRTKQLKLLNTASSFLKEKGILVYSVCSTEPEECDQAVNEFLKTNTEFRIIDKYAPFLRGLTDTGGFFRTYPHLHNMDGFSGVALCKKR